MPDQYEVRIRKEALKFAASHMTVFPDGTKEALHGHQYQPTLSLFSGETGFESMIAFSTIKESMKKIAKLWDEKVLIATGNPFFEILRNTREEIEFTLCGKRYVLPADEVVLLKVDNITCERLARAYFEFLVSDLEEVLKKGKISSMCVFIEESPGQGAAFRHEL
jgi:6-pyruvoyltetrahydropterin/6-carboxytetrahydropterin synthase